MLFTRNASRDHRVRNVKRNGSNKVHINPSAAKQSQPTNQIKFTFTLLLPTAVKICSPWKHQDPTALTRDTKLFTQSISH